MKRRNFLGALTLTAPWWGVPAAFAHDSYPAKPIKLILPFTAGGQSDVVARLIAERLGAELKQAVIVENIGGAGGMIAAANVARAAPDGYTLFLPNASTLTIAPYLQRGSITKLPAFVPITTVTQFPLVLVVNSNSPFQSLADVIAAAKAKPGKLSIASPGYGTTPHLLAETFKREAGIELTHVPYKGGAPALNDILSGQVDLYFEAPTILLPQIQAGRIRPLAVTSKTRMRALPSVPTVSDLGMPKLSLESWSAFVAPPNTPTEIIAKLRVEIEKVIKSDDTASRLRERGFEPTSSTPEQLARMIRDEGAVWSQLIQERKISTD